MERLLTGLAARTGQGPFVADQTGAYHLRIDGHSLFLARQGADLIVHSPLDWQARADAAGQREVLRDVLEHVTRWSRHYPQALVLDENDRLLLEARLEFASLELDELERVLAAQVGILESLKPGLQQAERLPQWTPTLWRP